MRPVSLGTSKKDKLINTLIIIVIILVLLCAALCIILFFINGGAAIASAGDESDFNNQTLENELLEYKAKYEQGKEEIEVLENQLSYLRDQIDTLTNEVNELESYNSSSNELEKNISELKKTITQNESKIYELENTIDAYKSLSDVDLEEQVKLINELIAKLMNAPRRVVETNSDSNDGSSASTSTYKNANVALYYEDLTTGYKIEYNSQKVMYSASLIKAPYVWTLLEQISDYEKKQSVENTIYDLNRMWTYDSKTMFRSGSGQIQKMDSGTQMTYYELVQYALEYSDNVAFGELRAVFGYTYFYSAASKIGVTSMSSSFNNLSAADAGKFLKEIYSFIESGDKYGTMMKNSMLTANYRVLIPAAVSPKPVAHKYGWDINSYHDMGIVYDEHPYIIVIMTDLDEGNSTARSFINGVVSTVDKIHTNFYR